jgi:predicted Zn-dependent protease
MKKAPLNAFVALITGVVLLFTTPASGITISEEEALSREFMKTVFSRFNLIRDPYIVAYVDRIGQHIVSSLPAPPFAYHFYVLNMKDFNAFATPAGHIFMYSGLIEAMDSEGELAGILAHEIAHVHCRHISQKIERSGKINIATLAGLAAGVLLGAGGAATAAQAVSIGSIAAGQSIQLAFSRDDEIQADQIGVAYMEKSGYRPSALLSILGKIRGRQWFGPNQIPSYLSTHPAIDDRMAYIDTWLEKHPNGISISATGQFDQIRVRLIALYGDEKQALAHFQTGLRETPDDWLMLYGMGLFLDRTGNRKASAEYLQRVLEKNPLDSMVLADLGKAYFFDGRLEDSKNALEGAVSINAQNVEARFYLGRIYLESNNFPEAIANFESVAKDPVMNEDAYYFLGDAHGKSGSLPEAHYYLGCHYLAKRDLKNAIFHFQKALEGIGDPEKRQHIESVLPELRADFKNALGKQ